METDGSANLKTQGVDTQIQDLDITTTARGIEIFRESLREFAVKDYFSEKINGRTLICNIEDEEIEINHYGDRENNMYEEIKNIKWGDIEVPILPLSLAKTFYEGINREEKVKLINEYI